MTSNGLFVSPEPFNSRGFDPPIIGRAARENITTYWEHVLGTRIGNAVIICEAVSRSHPEIDFTDGEDMFRPREERSRLEGEV